jgi:hypothetical protein
VTWGSDELGDVAANRDVAFPPLHAEHDNGAWDTVFTIRVPYLVNGARYRGLIAGLERWADDQGLTDFLPEGDSLSYTARPATKIKEDDDPDGDPSQAIDLHH